MNSRSQQPHSSLSLEEDGIPRLLTKLAGKLSLPKPELSNFYSAILHPKPREQALIWCRGKDPNFFSSKTFPSLALPPHIQFLDADVRASAHPSHEQGAFYLMDASSAFVGLVISQIPRAAEIVLDVCASPGGKSVLAWTAHQPKLLIANEAIRKRTAALIANFKRCKIAPAIVTSLDPKPLAEHARESCNLVLVDAPCSGQSLLAQGKKADGCFHPLVIRQNSKRQRRILAESSTCVAAGGHLIYSTCTFSPEENEENVAWFLEHFPEFSALTFSELSAYQSHLTPHPCYRVWPQHGPGAGVFVAAFQRSGNPSAEAQAIDFAPLHTIWQSA